MEVLFYSASNYELMSLQKLERDTGTGNVNFAVWVLNEQLDCECTVMFTTSFIPPLRRALRDFKFATRIQPRTCGHTQGPF